MSNYRYELGGIIRDLKCDIPYPTDDIVNLLDEKDQRIKELEEQLSTATMYHGCEALVNELKQENQQLKQQLEETKQNFNYQVMLMCSKENVLLKQQLHDLPKKIVGEIKTEVEKEKSDNDLAWLGFKKLNRILDTILKKYGGK